MLLGSWPAGCWRGGKGVGRWVRRQQTLKSALDIGVKGTGSRVQGGLSYEALSNQVWLGLTSSVGLSHGLTSRCCLKGLRELGVSSPLTMDFICPVAQKDFTHLMHTKGLRSTVGPKGDHAPDGPEGLEHVHAGDEALRGGGRVVVRPQQRQDDVLLLGQRAARELLQQAKQACAYASVQARSF